MLNIVISSDNDSGDSDNDSDNSDGNSNKYQDMFTDDDSTLERSINSLKNVENYRGTYEEEENKDGLDDINSEIYDNNE